MQVLTTMASGHHEAHGSGYAQDSWMGLGHQYSQPHHSISPMHEYPGFEYGPSPLTMEPAYTMPRPPPYAPSHHPLPPPLVMPQNNGVWPSMLTSQGTYQTPILPANPIHTPVSAAPSHGSDMTPTSAKSTSRRKLTDEERRQMCLEAEQNPTMKQTQIGAKFNVERSTVSKILRQKEKYMKPVPKEELTSPGKKSKIKLPDVEKTLANWARNQQRKGVPITDEELKKQALMFSAGRSDQQLHSSSTWLDRFKQRYLDGQGDPITPLLETPIDGSPSSSSGLASPPMSTSDDRPMTMTKFEKSENHFDFESTENAYEQRSALHHDVPADMDPSGEAILSPISPGLGRRDGLAVDIAENEYAGLNFLRQRSQTFPHLPEATSLSQPSPSQMTYMPVRPMTNQPNDTTRDISIDPRHMMKRHKSVPDIHDTEAVRYSTMQPPPLPRSADLSPVSNPGSPSVQDDHNIRALVSIQKLLEQRPDVAEPDDYIAIGKLMEKLRLLRSPNSTPSLNASMHAVELAPSPRISKKRTILGIST